MNKSESEVLQSVKYCNEAVKNRVLEAVFGLTAFTAGALTVAEVLNEDANPIGAGAKAVFTIAFSAATRAAHSEANVYEQAAAIKMAAGE